MPDRLSMLEEFYQTIIDMTLNHDVLDEQAVIYASTLGTALDKVDKEWWRKGLHA